MCFIAHVVYTYGTGWVFIGFLTISCFMNIPRSHPLGSMKSIEVRGSTRHGTQVCENDANTWRIIPGLGYVANNHGDRFRPRIGVVGPLPNGLNRGYKCD